MEKVFSLTDNIPTTAATTIDRKKQTLDSISNLPLFLDSLHFHDYTIKYTRQEKVTLLRYIQSIYPQIYLNNNQPLDYKNQSQQPVEYLCMNPACREKCTKNLNNLLYISTAKRKHDYSFLLSDPKRSFHRYAVIYVTTSFQIIRKTMIVFCLKIRGISTTSIEISRKKIAVQTIICCTRNS